jgi:hypothetical protein
VEREPTPEGAAVHRIADQHTPNARPQQQFTDRAAGSDTDPGGVTGDLSREPRRTIDRTISATCQIHGARGFCNLRVTRAGDGIVLNPHVAGSCVITLDEAGTTALRDLLIEWQGRKGCR